MTSPSIGATIAGLHLSKPLSDDRKAEQQAKIEVAKKGK